MSGRLGRTVDQQFLEQLLARTQSRFANLDIAIRIALVADGQRSEEHTSELQSLMRISYAVFCLKKKKTLKEKIKQNFNIMYKSATRNTVPKIQQTLRHILTTTHNSLSRNN